MSRVLRYPWAMPRLPTRADLVRCLTESPRALHARELATRCGVAEPEYHKLLELLDRLVLEETIVRMPGTRFKAVRAARTIESWEGLLSVHPRGFGFVASAGRDDVYIAPDGIGAALHGDRVEVMVVTRSARGAEGRIDRIVARRSPRVAGVVRKRGKATWLEPDDARVRGPMVLSGADDATDGSAAVATITRFPELAEENPEAALVAVLGRPGDPNCEVAKILLREQIEELHPEAAMREAEAIALRRALPGVATRVDLRGVPLPTIDPEDARDHDDAVWVERQGDGYRAWIAIADVSEYVTPNSALDTAAVERGCSIYLPDRALPMLPAALSADACSLLPDRDRLCLAVIADLDRDARVVRYEVVEGVIRSAAMLTYGGVARALGFDPDAPGSAAAEAFKRDLKVVDELARKLRRARLKRGALDLDLPEPKVVLDAEGIPRDVVRRAQSDGMKRAYQMVEELMLLANELVARFLLERSAPAIFRVHAKPDEQKLERLANVCETLDVPIDLDTLVEPRGVARWLASVAEHPRHHVLNTLLLRSLKQASYDVTNVGHFGLASDAYLHFTSPIRRYPDLAVHRQVKRLLRGTPPDTSPEAVEALREQATRASARERSAAEIEREVVDLYRCLFMRGHIGETYEGVVSGITSSGAFVVLDDPFVDVLVRLESLGPDHYEPTEDELALVGLRSGDSIALGDRVTVEVEDVAVLRRTVYARRLAPEGVTRELQKQLGRRGHKPSGARVQAQPSRAGRAARPTRGAPATPTKARPTTGTKARGRKPTRRR